MSVIPSQVTNLEGYAKMLQIERTSVFQQSDLGSFSQSGSPIIFNLPPGLLDLRRSFFQMRAVLTPGAASTNAFPMPFSAVFNRVVIRIGQTVCFDCYDAGFLQGLFVGQQLSSSVANVDEFGSAIAATRATQSATAQMYQFHMNVELLQKILPTNRLGSDSNLRIELWIDSLLNFQETVTGVNAATAFLVDQAQFFYHLIKETADVKAFIDAQIASGNYVVNYMGIESSTNTLLSATAQTVNLPFHKGCMRGIVVANSPLANLNNGASITPGSKYVNDYPITSFIQAYLKIGGQMYPAQPYDATVPAGYKIIHQDGRAFFHRWRDAHSKNNDIFIYNTTNQTNGLVVAYDFRLDTTNDLLLGNGINNQSSGANAIVNMNWSAGPGNQMMHSFCFFEASVRFSSGGVSYTA